MLHSPQRPLHTNMLGGALTILVVGVELGADAMVGPAGIHALTPAVAKLTRLMSLDLECECSTCTAGCVNKQLNGHRLTTCGTMISQQL